MACDIKILSASGTSLAQQANANTITIGGSAEDCAQVNVTITCAGGSASKVADVGFNGSWAAIFDTSALGCPCGQGFGVAAACVGNPTCFTETSFDLECTACPDITGIGFIVHVTPPTPVCVNGTTRVKVTVLATGTPGPGTYEWDFDDGSTATTNVPSVDHMFEFPALTYNVKLDFTPADPACPPVSRVKSLVVPDCSTVTPPPTPKGRPDGIIDKTDVDHRPRPDGIIDKTDVEPKPKGNGGGGRLSCDALLVAAIMLLIAGGATIAIAICTKAGGYAILAGVVGLVLGAGLFALWFAICGKITSCDVMQKMHWTLGMIILAGVPLGLIGLGAQAAGLGVKLDAACWAAILGNLAAIGWLKDRLREIMEDANCTPTSLF